MSAKKVNVPWTKGPWKLRTSQNGLPPFVEAPKAKGLAYSLDVCGDDYTGYGDDDQRLVNMELITLAPEMATTIMSGSPTLIEDMAGRLEKLCDKYGN